MNEIRYNQASTLGQIVLIAGLTLQVFPANLPRGISEQSNKSMLGAAYSETTNAATYSRLSSAFKGEYSYVATRDEQPCMSSELAEFLLHSSHVSWSVLDRLLVAIRDTYGNVQIDTSIHTDPEEGWVKPVLTVHSGIEDFDKLMDVEDVFFAKAANDADLIAILPYVVVSQV